MATCFVCSEFTMKLVEKLESQHNDEEGQAQTREATNITDHTQTSRKLQLCVDNIVSQLLPNNLSSITGKYNNIRSNIPCTHDYRKLHRKVKPNPKNHNARHNTNLAPNKNVLEHELNENNHWSIQYQLQLHP